MKGKLPANESAQPAVQPSAAEGEPGTPDRARIRGQMESVLASAPFRNSKRYPALLRYLVEHAVDGKTADLKERTLGVEVFGRDSGYDPAADPVVRTSAGEIRRRLAQYYQDTTHAGELRIHLPIGSYVPEFAEPDLAGPAEAAVWERQSAPAKHSRWWTGAVVLLALAVAFVIVVKRERAASPTEDFWRPVVTPPGRVMVCVGQAGVPARQGAGADGRRGMVSWLDALTLGQIGVFLKASGASPQFYREDRATFTDLQQGPAVLIGGLNDEWALRLMQGLRFQFRRDGATYYIADREHPDSRTWSIAVDNLGPDARPVLERDYAVISRLANARTGRMTVTLAGLWTYGTAAAGQFVTDPKYLQSLSQSAPAGWARKNLQLVIGIEVIDESAGPPQVLAATYW